MGLLLVLLLLVVAAGPGMRLWGRSLTSGRWRHSAGWFAGTAGLLLSGTAVTYLIGSLTGTSLDPEEACHAVGQTYDRAYRRANFEEYTRWFPLHDKCHAGHDLVPGWVNPTLIVLPVLAAACLAFSVRLAVLRRRAKKGAVPPTELEPAGTTCVRHGSSADRPSPPSTAACRGESHRWPRRSTGLRPALSTRSFAGSGFRWRGRRR